MNPYLIVDGVVAAQTINIETPFLSVINEFDLIIEIGFHRGGFSQWLHTNKNQQTKLYCYDVTNEDKLINNENINFIIGDCFNDKIINEINDLIQTSGKSLILCDGGNKISEFNLYSKYLKSGDVIMCHDYSHNNEDFIQISTELNWPHYSESNYDGIQSSVESLGLNPYNYDIFKGVLWGSFIKG